MAAAGDELTASEAQGMTQAQLAGKSLRRGLILLDIHANLYVERDSQKGIIIGHQGSRLRAIGTAARTQIEALFGTPVYLDLQVKVAKDWQRDPKQLKKLGF